MALSPWVVKKYEHLLDDDLIKGAVDLMENRRKEFAEWIKENDPECPKCGRIEGMEYKWNKKICSVCGEFDYKVPFPSNGGKTPSRTLYQIVKELFSLKLAREKIDETPSKSQLKDLPIYLDNFNTGEYSSAEVKYLSTRYKELTDAAREEMKELSKKDEFLYHLLVMQEIRLKKIFREEAISTRESKSRSLAKKREVEVYTSLLSDIEKSKAVYKQEKTDEKTVLEELNDSIGEININNLIKEHEKQTEEEKKELELSRKRRMDVGNKW